MLDLYNNLSTKYGIKFFNADNLVDRKYGCGSECCGTEFLRNHKIWGGCLRSKVFNNDDNICSSEFGKCLVNFTRATNQKGITKFKTIEEYTKEYIEKETKRLRDLEYANKHKQLNLF